MTKEYEEYLKQVKENTDAVERFTKLNCVVQLLSAGIYSNPMEIDSAIDLVDKIDEKLKSKD